MSEYWHFNRARVDERRIAELIGLARGMVADDVLADCEVEYLYKWLSASEGAEEHPFLRPLIHRLDQVFADDRIDEEERAELFETLKGLAGGEFELGEASKPSTLPLCKPAPDVYFDQARFTFTGTCIFGTRKDCEAAVAERGGIAGSLRKDTVFLVIGEYANESWAQSTYGRKIEKAAGWRETGVPINIISEAHWRTALI